MSDSTPSSPYNHTLYLGYGRAILANLEESSHELIATTTQKMQLHCYHDHQKDWWYIIAHPTPQSQDPLFELPKFTDPSQYQPLSKSAFLQSMPYFTHLGYDLPSCNIQNSSISSHYVLGRLPLKVKMCFWAITFLFLPSFQIFNSRLKTLFVWSQSPGTTL